MCRWRRLAPIVGIAFLVASWSVSGPVGAQEPSSGDRLVLRAVDSSDRQAVRIVFGWTGAPAAAGDLVVEENGEAATAEVVSALDAGVSNDVVFVVDSSTSTDADALLTTARDMLAPFVAELPPGMRVGLVTAGALAQQLQPLTTDVTRLQDGLDALTPGGEGGLLAGLLRASDMLSRTQGSMRTIVLITDGVSDATTSLRDAEIAVDEAGAAVFVVGLQDGGLDVNGFTDLADTTGGKAVFMSDPAELDQAFESLRPELTGLFVATFESLEEQGIQELNLRIGDVTADGSYISGSNLAGASELAPRPIVSPGGIEWLQGDLGKYLALGAALLAAILLAYGLVLLFVRDDTGLSSVLRPYSDGYVAASDEDDEEAQQGYAQTAFLQRAVQFTEDFAQRQGFLTRIEQKLEKADMPLRAGEAMFFYLAGAVLISVLALVISQNLLGTIVIGGLAFIVPPAVVNFLAARKKRRFEALLPDTLQLLSSTLRAGYSMMQGIEAVSVEAAEPMGRELRRVVTEARLGRPLEESLEAIAERMGSGDFGWAVMAIRIQREVGGNLSELLLTVSETMTARERLRRDVSALTAEGRVSAYLLGALPVILGFVLFGLNPDYMGKLFEETIGQIALGIAIIMAVVGFLWMNKIIKIDI